MLQGCGSAYNQRQRGGRRQLQWAPVPGLHARLQPFRRYDQRDATGAYSADAQLISGARASLLAANIVPVILDKQVVGDWNELQYLTTALKQWRMLPDFSCLDEGTRIGTAYLPILQLKFPRLQALLVMLLTLTFVFGHVLGST